MNKEKVEFNVGDVVYTKPLAAIKCYYGVYVISSKWSDYCGHKGTIVRKEWETVGFAYYIKFSDSVKARGTSKLIPWYIHDLDLLHMKLELLDG